MNQRPSTSGIQMAEEAHSLAQPAQPRRVGSVRRGLLVFLGIAPLLVIGAGTSIALRFLRQSMSDDENARIVNAASLSKQLVDRVLAERSRQVALVASSPSVVAAAERGNTISRERGLTDKSVGELE